MKERLDVLLVSKGFFKSRERARTSIMAGLVYVDGGISDKPGTKIKEDAVITIKGDICPYVSRGGLKLAKALSVFDIDLSGLVCMDIGASTGGFSDCMLKNGAKKVYAIDVGYGQLDYKLRNDSRIVNMERVNVRYLDTESITDEIDFISIDVSFISLNLIFPVVSVLLAPGKEVVCLIKPQFEAGREQVGKNGIVREKSTHIEVIKNVGSYASNNHLMVAGLSFSPMTGAKGNIEYLMRLIRSADKETHVEESQDVNSAIQSHDDLSFYDYCEQVVTEAHSSLYKNI